MDTTPRAPATPLPRMSGPHYIPKVGDSITIELPDERTRGVVESVVSDTAVIAKLATFTTSKSHNYRKGDMVPCRFGMLDMTIPGWRVVSRRELDESAEAAESEKRSRGLALDVARKAEKKAKVKPKAKPKSKKKG